MSNQDQFQEDLQLMLMLDESFRELRSMINTYWSKYSIAGIGITHGRMMTYIAEYGPMKASQIAEKLYITCGAVTGLSDKLIELGFVAREKDDNDRRVVLLKLTSKGEEQVKKIKDIRRNLMIHLFAELSSEEMKDGLKLFDKLKDNMVNFNNQY